MLGNEAVELRSERDVTAERQVRVDPRFERGEAQLLQPFAGRASERLVREVCKRRTSPQVERRP